MTFPFPPLWMRDQNGDLVDISYIYWFVILAFLLCIVLPLFAYGIEE